MSDDGGVKELTTYAVVTGDNATGKRSKKRKKRTQSNAAGTSTIGWRKVDLGDDLHIEGFADGCAYDLEELTDYQVEKTESGGHFLVINNSSATGANGTTSAEDTDASASTKKKNKRKKKRSKAKTEAATESLQCGGEEEDGEPVLVEDDNDNDHDSESDDDADDGKAPQKKKAAKTPKQGKKQDPPVPVKPVKLPKWDKFKLHPLLRHSLHRCGFMTPTIIQEKTIYPALVDNRDVVGAAPTGSGKTLAFGLPILNQLLNEKEQPGYVKDCKALILTPTRELALQICQHLENMVPNREIGIMSLVGGMSVQKQRRMLTYTPEIVVGTPGRLWDLMDSTSDAHLREIHRTLRFFVIDEADRMLQKGAYPEVEKIFDAVRKSGKVSQPSDLHDLSDSEDEEDEDDDGEDEGEDDDEESDDGDGDDGEEGNRKPRTRKSMMAGEAKVVMLEDVLRMHQNKDNENDEESDALEQDEEIEKSEEAEEVVAPIRFTRQTFLFSATLTIPEGGRFQSGKKKKPSHRDALTVLESVMKRVGMRGKPAVVDLSIDDDTNADALSEKKIQQRKANVALSLPSGLELCQHEVTESSRDSYLYYFLTQYPGKTIVFLNAIHQVRKLAGLLTLLKLPVFALHAEMQQRQRLKKLDGFRTNPHGILIATDVAARGLDIPSVDYVVHYHIARSTEVFMHRSGRTARANKEGLSISLVAPVDAKNHAQICKMLQRPTGLSDFPFDHRFLPVIDERLRLAKAVNDYDNVAGKVKSEETWFSQMAEAADLDLDENLLSELRSKKDKGESGKKKNGESVESMRIELSHLVAQPLRPVGSVRKFRQLYQDIGSDLAKDGEYRKRDASEDLEGKAKKSYKRFRRRK